VILYLSNIVVVVVVISVLLLLSCVELMLKKLKITLQKNQEHIYLSYNNIINAFKGVFDEIDE